MRLRMKNFLFSSRFFVDKFFEILCVLGHCCVQVKSELHINRFAQNFIVHPSDRERENSSASTKL
jgi:hypothetical protein